MHHFPSSVQASVVQRNKTLREKSFIRIFFWHKGDVVTGKWMLRNNVNQCNTNTNLQKTIKKSPVFLLHSLFHKKCKPFNSKALSISTSRGKPFGSRQQFCFRGDQLLSQLLNRSRKPRAAWGFLRVSTKVGYYIFQLKIIGWNISTAALLLTRCPWEWYQYDFAPRKASGSWLAFQEP